MSHSNGTIAFKSAVSRIENCLRGCNLDYFDRDGFITAKLEDAGAGHYLLRYGQHDQRRNLDPRHFSEHSVQCFCDWSAKCPQEANNECFAVTGAASNVFLLADRVHQFANQCGPEPAEEHYADMTELAAAIRVPSLTVVNLANSGASVPQHFHTQIYPLHDLPKGGNSVRSLWDAVRTAGPRATVNGVEVCEVVHPAWGLRLRFDERYSDRDIGKLVYRSLHRDVRYRSQLMLTYNLFVPSPNSREVTVLLRESHKERVFQLDECHDLLRQFTTASAAHRIARSPNAQWRWAWLELLGGFPARDDSFADTATFNGRFWSELLEIAGLAGRLRAGVYDQVLRSLEKVPLSKAGRKRPSR